MATSSKSNLRNFVNRLVQLGRTQREIFTKVKQDKRLRNSNNTSIQTAIDAARLSKNRASQANAMDRSKTIGDIFKKDKKSKPKRICVGYEFNHDAGGKNKRGSGGANDELGSVEVDANLSVYEVRSVILDKIRQWLDRHYETSNQRTIKSSLKLTSIQEC